jgi:creatinine amidohydrolase/Fe(II)-dependent formamide hydrolase-like protein
VLCLPFGSCEQHGPHLPLNTDTIIAERFTERVVAQFGEEHDLWILPTIPYGLSLEHAWTSGTVSLRVRLVAELLDAIVGEYVRAAPARRLLIVNGHGGNRGVLEGLVYELERAHQVRICVVHPSSLSTVLVDSDMPEIHAGIRETSMMLALSPVDVHLSVLDDAFVIDDIKRAAIKQLILDRGTTWPWSSGDERIATLGITGGDPRNASAEVGEAIVASAIDACAAVLKSL